MEAWIRQGPIPRQLQRPQLNIRVVICLRTAERELSEFVGEHRWFDTAHLVRGSPRLHRLASAHAGYFGWGPRNPRPSDSREDVLN